MKKLLFIMNPFAGTKKANRYLPQIISVFNNAGYEVIAYMTAGRGDASRIAALRGDQVDLVVCCGGDGTFNETVSGLLSAGIHKPIGYIPAGSTNDFAASIHLPTDILAAAQVCVEGTPSAYDVGKFDERYFSYVASFGAFTRVSYATDQSVKNALGHLAYILGGIQELSQIKHTHMRLTLSDGQVIEDDFIFGAISNSTSVGGILTLDPQQVDMTDGKFEVLLVRAPKDLVELTECLIALQKKTYNCAMVTFLSTDRVHVTSPEGVDWTLDGEWQAGHREINIQCLHQKIEIMKDVSTLA